MAAIEGEPAPIIRRPAGCAAMAKPPRPDGFYDRGVAIQDCQSSRIAREIKSFRISTVLWEPAIAEPAERIPPTRCRCGSCGHHRGARDAFGSDRPGPCPSHRDVDEELVVCAMQAMQSASPAL